MSDLDDFFESAQDKARADVRRTNSLEEKVVFQLLKATGEPRTLAQLRRDAQGDLTFAWFYEQRPGSQTRLGCTARAWRFDVPALGFMRKFHKSNLFRELSTWAGRNNCNLKTESWMFFFRWARQVYVLHNGQWAYRVGSHLCYRDTKLGWCLYVELYADVLQGIQATWP